MTSKWLGITGMIILLAGAVLLGAGFYLEETYFERLLDCIPPDALLGSEEFFDCAVSTSDGGSAKVAGAILMATAAMIGLINLAFTSPARGPAIPRRECPWCAENIKPAASVCRFCGRDIDPVISTPTGWMNEDDFGGDEPVGWSVQIQGVGDVVDSDMDQVVNRLAETAGLEPEEARFAMENLSPLSPFSITFGADLITAQSFERELKLLGVIADVQRVEDRTDPPSKNY